MSCPTPAPDRESKRAGRLSAAGLLAVLAVGALFRAHDLGKECFDGDELYAVRIQGSVLKTLGTVMARDAFHTNHPPLMTVPYVLWGTVFGRGELAIRLLPFLCGLLAIVLLYRLACVVGGPWVGLLAAAALALNPLHIAYSQEARNYALLIALCVAAHLLLVRILQGARRWAWVSYWLVCLAALFTHYFAVPALAAHGVIALWLIYSGDERSRRHAAQALLTLVLAAVPFLSWLPVIRWQAQQPWKHLALGDTGNLVGALSIVAGLGRGPVVLISATAFVALCTAALLACRRVGLATSGGADTPFPRWAGVLLLAGGLVTGGTLFALTPALVLPAARQTLTAYGYDPLTVGRELQLLRAEMVAIPLTLAATGVGMIWWSALIRLLEHLPHTGRGRPLSVAVLVTTLLLVPVLLVRAAGLMGIPLVTSRNLLIMVPPFSLAVALGLAALARTKPGRLAAVALTCALGVGAWQYEPVCGPFGLDGTPLGIHTSSAWRDLGSRLGGRGPRPSLLAVMESTTDPLLYYLPEYNPRRVRDAEEVLEGPYPDRFWLLHLEGDADSTRLVEGLAQRKARLEPILHLDQFTVFDTHLAARRGRAGARRSPGARTSSRRPPTTGQTSSLSRRW